ncbi:hypothetical protein BDN70DRAFT_642905 [Pholiota conissans]|uniref:Uncharacterized protein n=1 Tax=Pholiota conissans TaxID=109636 RepID=A0A9P5YK99_9AGAR|nr:hypothetical protein BDN70DRAFT_642905 [Pholiota conissans]
MTTPDSSTSAFASPTGPPTTSTAPVPQTCRAHPRRCVRRARTAHRALNHRWDLPASPMYGYAAQGKAREKSRGSCESYYNLIRGYKVWTTKPSKAPLTPFILQPSQQYHALPRYTYGADLQADYTLFLLSPTPKSSSLNVPSSTSRPSTAKHNHNASRAQSLSPGDPVVFPSPRPSTTSPHPSSASTSRPSPSSTSSVLPPFIDTLPHLQSHIHLQARRDHLPSSKVNEAMHIHRHSHSREGSAVSLDASLATSSSSLVASTRSTTTNAGRLGGRGYPSAEIYSVMERMRRGVRWGEEGGHWL